MRTYVVQSGDTLSTIAQRHRLALTALLQANPQIINMNLIRAGQTINIPDGDEDATRGEEALPFTGHPPEPPVFHGLTAQQLQAIVPTLLPGEAARLVDAINQAMKEADINTSVRQAAFLAQIAHETGGFQWFRERGPNESFSRYDNRKELGNIAPGDGARYRGRGCIQITGGANYQKAAEALGVDLVHEPQLAEKPDIAARIAAWYWRSHDLNACADRGDFITITRRINGGLHKLPDREAFYERAKDVLGVV